jgi:hypothetical protein
MRTSLPVFLLFCAQASTPAVAASTAESVLARAKQSSGGPAWDRVTTLHTEASLATSGLTGTTAAFDDLVHGRTLDRFTLGPASGAQGYDGKRVWSVDQSGQVREEEGGEARLAAINDAYRRRLAHWYPDRAKAHIEYSGKREEAGRSLHVLAITPEGGRPFDLWIDAATGLVDRFVEKMALETRTTTYSDYRDVQGVKLPFRIRSTNGEAKYDQLFEVAQVKINEPLSDGLFTMPAPPPPDFAFADGNTSTSVPFKLINNHIYLDVMLDGKGPFRMLCDTGGSNIVTPTVARELGLEVQGKLQGRGVGEKSEDVGLAKVKSLTVGGVTLRDPLFAVFPMEDFQKVEGVPEQGIIGYEVFKRFVVEVSYGKSRLTLTLPSAFHYSGKGTAVPFVFNDHIPQVDGELDGIPGKFDLDTGSRSSVDLFGPFAAKHGLEKKYRATVPMVTGWGVGGPARGRVFRARVLKLGPMEVKEPMAAISVQKEGGFKDPYVAGNVGGGVLKRFDLTFDYGGKRIWFERNANDAVRDTFDRSGMWVNLDGESFLVVDVLEGGPAQRAGLREGERIVSVDGKPSAAMTLPDFRTLLRTRAVGERVTVEVEAAGKRRSATLVLRDLP